jgi:hypothetical protein
VRKLPDPAISQRILGLKPSLPAIWGRMNAHQMICHLDDSFKVGLGERKVGSISNPFKRTVMKWGALYVPAPWPKGTPTMAEVEQGVGGTPPADFEGDRARLLKTVELFCEPQRSFGPIEHPFFGRLTTSQWMRWGFLHADHHLRQFGL